MREEGWGTERGEGAKRDSRLRGERMEVEEKRAVGERRAVADKRLRGDSTPPGPKKLFELRVGRGRGVGRGIIRFEGVAYEGAGRRRGEGGEVGWKAATA